MLYNYLKTAIRSILRHQFFSAINIFGLAVAMSICMAIIMIVADQMSYDRHNTNAHRIYRVTTLDLDEKGNLMTYNQVNSASCMPLGPELVRSYSGIEKAVRLRRGFGNNWLEFEGRDVNIPLSGFFADADVLGFFQYELEHGDAATALKDPFTVVLTRAAANKLFKEENPVGLTIKVGDIGLYTVTGVLKETNQKTHIAFEGLASMASVPGLEASGKLPKIADNWGDYWQGWTYVLAAENITEDGLQQQLDRAFNDHIASHSAPGFYKMRFFTQPLLDITPGAMMGNSIGPQLPWELVYFLSGLALVILLTSCFNFTNLSMARSLSRAREIGVRKVTGAARRQIFTQFILEAVAIALAALLLAILLLTLVKPMLLQLNFARLFRWDLYNGISVYALFIVFAVVVGVLAGFFPAVVLSGFQPVTVLRNLSNLKVFSRMGLRKLLLISQFTLSIIFIMTVIVMHRQLNLFTHQDHHFNIKDNILIKLNNTSYQALKTELKKYNNITSIAAASHVPAAGTSYGCGIKKTANDPIINADYFLVDEDYLPNMEVKLLAGDFFTEARGESNKNFVVINRSTLQKLSYIRPQDAVGETIIFANDSTTKTIIGVVEDYNHRDLTRAITPMILLYDPVEFNVLQVAYSGSYENAGKTIEKAWAAVNPGLKPDYIPVASEINQYYQMVFGDLVKVLGFVAFLAILISCLGLLGMVTYATESRTKEISIRKVLGISNGALVMLLSKGFAAMLAVAVIIGVPLASFLNNLWLETLAYHTTIGFGVIGLSVLVLLFFGVITTGSQTIRVLFVKSVEGLKSE